MKKHYQDYRKEAKVLLFDLEVSPTLMWGYGQYEVHPIKVEQAPVLLALSWKWLGDKGKPQGLTLEDKRLVDKFNDKLLVKELWNLLDEAQVVVAHNGARFDVKMANAFFARHNMTPPSPYKVFDTLQTARRFFRFDNNTLDYLGHLLVDEGKTEQRYGDCWEELLLSEDKKKRKKAAKTMDEYCRQDVNVLEKVYERLLPWATNHPNMALFAGRPDVCPRCGFEATFKIKSYRRTGVQVNAIQYQCSHCHSYVTRSLTKEERAELDEEGRLKSEYRNLSA